MSTTPKLAHGKYSSVSSRSPGSSSSLSPSTPSPTGTPQKTSLFNRLVSKGRGSPLSRIEQTENECENLPNFIENHEYLASYNWKDDSHATIYVPGCPPKWTQPPLPTRLPKDSGKMMVDQNGFRSPGATFDPLFKALFTMKPNFDLSAITLVTDRNNLRKLLTFASGKFEAWRIDVDVVGSVMFFTRWEPALIQRANGGYGHEFEKAFTTMNSDLKDSTSHHRITHLTLGGLECILRYEADAYLEEESFVTTKTEDSPGTKNDDLYTVTELEETLNSLSLTSPAALAATTPTTGVRVIQRGRLVPPSSIAEIKSRSKVKGRIQMMPQLWFSQTPHLIVAHHTDGLIEKDPEKDHLGFESWEMNHKKELAGLIKVLRDIREVAIKVKGGKCMVVYEKDERGKCLRVYERMGGDIKLPAGVKEKCRNRNAT
ncbi:hypothetical protein BGZ60DRAFT_523709 [Tricladium varicosporioides]|nr:hypothetical protein BGZ60DRAFT_523709 [Hymenoscyphus varicosporioides]